MDKEDNILSNVIEYLENLFPCIKILPMQQQSNQCSQGYTA